MVTIHKVYCKDCGKHLSTWDMFHNAQCEEEWECNGKFRRKIDHHWRQPGTKNILVSHSPNDKYTIPVKSEVTYCSLHRNTKYCRTCAYRRHFKCGAPRCKGRLVKVRNKNGSYTKYTHGGW